MNTATTALPVEPPTIALQASAASPVKRMRALVLKMYAAFPECPQSLTILWHWLGEIAGLHQKWSRDIAAIDDEMERAAPILWGCLKNDPPAKRRLVWAAWQKTHANTEQTRAEVESHCL